MGRGLLIWLLIMIIESVLGTLRMLFLAPLVGADTADRIGWPVGLVIVVFTAWLLIRWTGLTRTSSLLALGAIWAVLTFFFEIGVGFLRGFDWPRIMAEIDPTQGGMLVYSLIVMLLAPLVAARLARV
jgi:hypothetical protein